jgi:hypothetical protein
MTTTEKVDQFLGEVDDLNLDDLERKARSAEDPAVRKFYYALFELVLDKKQTEIINEPGFVV